jgi:hypothetical protein
MSYSDKWREHLRIAILRVLAEAPAYTCNDSLMTDVLTGDDLRFAATRDQVRGEFAWLGEQGLIAVEAPSGSGLMIAGITARGMDVAAGKVTAPGVKRPSPRG